MFNFGIKQIYDAGRGQQRARISYSDDHKGWLWRNLTAFEEQCAVWIPLEPLTTDEIIGRYNRIAN